MTYASKAEQKRELQKLNNDCEKIKREMHNVILNNREKLFHLYWETPNYVHEWSSKKIEMFAPHFPEEIEAIKAMKEIRNAIKSTPICKPEPKTKVEERITTDIKAIIERRNQQYVRGVELARYFGKLNVHVNAHLVVNQYGTEFVRCFYYLNGDLTALNVIIAIAQKINDEKN